MDLSPQDVLRIARTLRERDFLEQSLGMYEVLLRVEPYASSIVADGQARREYALRLQDAGRYVEAVQEMELVLAGLNERAIDYQLQRVQLMADLGQIWFDSSDWSKTVATLEPTLALLRRALGVHRDTSAMSHLVLAEAFMNRGEPLEAIRVLDYLHLDRSWLAECAPELPGDLAYLKMRALMQIGGNAVEYLESVWDDLLVHRDTQSFELCWAHRVMLLCEAEHFDEAEELILMRDPERWRQTPTLFWLKIGFLKAWINAERGREREAELQSRMILNEAGRNRADNALAYFKLETDLAWLLGVLGDPDSYSEFVSILLQYRAGHAAQVPASMLDQAEDALARWPASRL